MGKAAKSRAKERRKARKKSMKASNKAKYDEWKRTGQNKKSSRAKANGKRAKRRSTMSHPEGACCNVGCKRCSTVKQAAALGAHLTKPVFVEKRLEQYKRRVGQL